MIHWKQVTLGCLIAVAALAPSGQAQSRGDALRVQAENETAKANGRSADALPGDVVRYELRFTNPRTTAVRNVVFDNPVPAGMHYEASSATADRAGVAVTYSIDGGRTFSAQPMIEQVVNGERRIVPAPAAMYSHVRWSVGTALAAGAKVTAAFKVRVAERTASNLY